MSEDLKFRLKSGREEDIPQLLRESFYHIFGNGEKRWTNLALGEERESLIDTWVKWKDNAHRENLLNTFINVKAYTSASELMIPEECWVVTITEVSNVVKNSWGVKLCRKNPHLSLPAVICREKSLAITLASIVSWEILRTSEGNINVGENSLSN